MKVLTVGGRLVALMTGAAAATIAVSVLAWTNLQQAGDAAAALEAGTLAVRATMQADMKHDASYAELRGAQVAALTEDTKALEAAAKPLQQAVDDLQGELDKALQSAQDDTSRRHLREAQRVAAVYREKTLAAYAALRQDAKAESAMRQYLAAFRALEKALDDVGEAIEAAAAATSEASRQSLARSRTLTLGVVTLIVGLLAAGGAMVIRSIQRPLRQLLAATRELDQGDGDLSRRLPPATAEFGELSRHFNGFIARIGAMVAEVQQSATQISSASAQIAAGNLDLSQRTEQSSSNLQQTAASVEQINATVQQGAEAARQACALAASASTVATRGGEVVGRVVATMEEISSASRRIADIIGTIDGIAFQTNILALNAAVEAARAGEQGRGFAVVAGEVRSLAQRSAEAAREIKALIGTSVEKVESGSAQVRDAGQTMDEIVGSVTRVTQMITEITAAAGEQSSGIALVNSAVSGLDRMTQQNAALVEQSAAASQALREQAARLATSVSGFRTQAA